MVGVGLLASSCGPLLLSGVVMFLSKHWLHKMEAPLLVCTEQIRRDSVNASGQKFPA